MDSYLGLITRLSNLADRSYFIIGDDTINIDHLKTKKIRRGYIVVNTNTSNHAHFKSEYGCFLIKKFIRKEIYPDNPYLQESHRRLTEEKKSYKERYNNKQVIRWKDT